LLLKPSETAILYVKIDRFNTVKASGLPVDSNIVTGRQQSLNCKTQSAAERPDVPQVSGISTDNENKAARRAAKWLPSAGENK